MPKSQPMNYSNRTLLNIIKRGSTAAAALVFLFAVSCADERRPTPGNIVDVNPPVPSAHGETASFSPAPTAASTIEPAAEPTPALYSFVSAANSELGRGQYVLVNHNHPYAHTDESESSVKPVEKTAHLLLANSGAQLLDEVNEALYAFAAGFHEASGGDRLLVTSAFRTEQYQRELYADYVKQHGEEMARIYVANPGSSEHHTGLAVDLSTMSRDGVRIPLIDHKNFDWVTSHCADYGFILRYPVGSEEITRVAYEPWHFRYLGRANAHACAALDLVYEDYIEHLKVYSVESGMLHVEIAESGAKVSVASMDALPDSGFLIYFVPASDGEFTLLPIPLACTDYRVSGNNEDGFIITASLGAAESGDY